MIIEDDFDILSLMTELLETEGYNVVSAGNGLEGLEILRGLSELPSLILLDLMMPKMDGYTFRDEQKKDDRIAQIPVIIMSAERHSPDKLKQTGALTFLKKPFTRLETILEPIAEYLSQQKS